MEKTINSLFKQIINNDNPAFYYRLDDRKIEISRKQFYNDVLSFASYISKIDSKRIAVISENSYLYIVSIFGITKANKTAVLIDYNLDELEIDQTLSSVDCHTIIYSNDYIDIADALKNRYNIIPIDKCNDNATFVDIAINEDDIALILFTSGTTGIKKAVPITHLNMYSELMGLYNHGINNHIELHNFFSVLPFYHCFGLFAGGLYSLINGQTVVLSSGLRNLIKDIEILQPTVIPLVPAMFDILIKYEESSSNHIPLKELLGPNFETLISGGAPLDDKIFNKFKDLNIKLSTGYGATESTSVIIFNFNLDKYPNSIGFPIVGCNVRIADDGEILLNGGMIVNNYLNLAEENKKSFIDGWYKTGDLGSIGKDGEVYFIGKKKRLIILGNGENVPAEPIEAKIKQLPYVKDVVVKDIDGLITAEVVLNNLDDNMEDILKKDIDNINKSLPLSHCVMKIIIMKDDFKKTDTGKIII